MLKYFDSKSKISNFIFFLKLKKFSKNKITVKRSVGEWIKNGFSLKNASLTSRPIIWNFYFINYFNLQFYRQKIMIFFVSNRNIQIVFWGIKKTNKNNINKIN